MVALAELPIELEAKFLEGLERRDVPVENLAPHLVEAEIAERVVQEEAERRTAVSCFLMFRRNVERELRVAVLPAQRRQARDADEPFHTVRREDHGIHADRRVRRLAFEPMLLIPIRDEVVLSCPSPNAPVVAPFARLVDVGPVECSKL